MLRNPGVTALSIPHLKNWRMLSSDAMSRLVTHSLRASASDLSACLSNHFEKKFERTLCKGIHVGDPVGTARAQRDRALCQTRNSQARMPGRITIAVSSRPGRTGFAEAPRRTMAFAHAPCDQLRIFLGRGAQSLHLWIADAKQCRARGLGIDHCAAKKVRRGAGHSKQGRSDEAHGR